MTISPLQTSYVWPGARRAADLQRRADDLRRRAWQCRDLADSALSTEGRDTLTELAVSFQSEADELERQLAARPQAAHCGF